MLFEFPMRLYGLIEWTLSLRSINSFILVFIHGAMKWRERVRESRLRSVFSERIWLFVHCGWWWWLLVLQSFWWLSYLHWLQNWLSPTGSTSVSGWPKAPVHLVLWSLIASWYNCMCLDFLFVICTCWEAMIFTPNRWILLWTVKLMLNSSLCYTLINHLLNSVLFIVRLILS